jgi:chromosome segregation ATPase
MLHYMHNQDKTAIQRSSGQKATAASSTAAKGATPIPAVVSIKEHARLMDEYKKQDTFLQELSYENELNKNRASKYKKTLKAQLEDLKVLQAKVDRYKAQVKTLLLHQQQTSSSGSPLVVERDSTSSSSSKQKLSECKSKLADAMKDLASLRAEMPEVKALLTKGGHAIQKLEAETKRSQDLQQQVADLKAKSRSSTDSGETVAALKAKNQQLQSEVVAVKDKLKAASQDVSARVNQVAACKDMLAKAEQVLRTCSDLHETKGDALAAALRETTANVQAFLQNLAVKNATTAL